MFTTTITDEMAEVISSTVTSRPYASFVELIEACGKQAEGDLSIVSAHFDNLVLWHGVSQEFIDALSKANVRMQPCSALVYLIDGRVPNIPVAKSCRPYKQSRWAPVCFIEANEENGPGISRTGKTGTAKFKNQHDSSKCPRGYSSGGQSIRFRQG
jgi:hypothetical protein